MEAESDHAVDEIAAIDDEEEGTAIQAKITALQKQIDLMTKLLTKTDVECRIVKALIKVFDDGDKVSNLINGNKVVELIFETSRASGDTKKALVQELVLRQNLAGRWIEQLDALKNELDQLSEQQLKISFNPFDVGLLSNISYIHDKNESYFKDRRLGLDKQGVPHSTRQTLNASRELCDAFDELIPLSNDRVAEALIRHVSALDESLVKVAWYPQTFPFMINRTKAMEDMVYHQFVYQPLTMLLMAAVGENGFEDERYKANQEISASLMVNYKDSQNRKAPEARRVTVRTDAAASLFDEYDVLGMIELKDDRMSSQVDIEKCTLLTTIAALAIQKCIKKDQYHEVVIPFVIAQGQICSLYAATLDEKGDPCIQVIGYPGGETAFRRNVSDWMGEERKKVFISFAVLLNKFKSFFRIHVLETYKTQLARRELDLMDERAFGLSATLSGNKRKDRDGNDGRTPLNKCTTTSNRQLAQDAAECEGMFADLKSPFIRTLLLTDNPVPSNDERTSPFYFVARHTAAAVGATMEKQTVFLKVFKVDNVRPGSVESEWKYHNLAFEAGVSVAAPLFPKVLRSTSACGSDYLVCAMEYIPQDRIDTIEQVWKYSTSLMTVVYQLHTTAGLLHCDLKPDNIRWRDGAVKLIDFGHAQPIHQATLAPGTKGFQAPEISNQEPCSESTDAFSVGKTILAKLDGLRLENSPDDCTLQRLVDVALNLSHSNPDTRWTLAQALNALSGGNHQNIESTVKDSMLPIKVESELYSLYSNQEDTDMKSQGTRTLRKDVQNPTTESADTCISTSCGAMHEPKWGSQVMQKTKTENNNLYSQ